MLLTWRCRYVSLFVESFQYEVNEIKYKAITPVANGIFLQAKPADCDELPLKGCALVYISQQQSSWSWGTSAFICHQTVWNWINSSRPAGLYEIRCSHANGIQTAARTRRNFHDANKYLSCEYTCCELFSLGQGYWARTSRNVHQHCQPKNRGKKVDFC